MPITDSAYGLGPAFAGQRIIESVSYQSTPERLIEYATLRHELGSAWLQVVTAWHRDPYVLTHGRRGRVGHRDAAIMGISAATHYLRLPNDRLHDLVDAEQLARESPGPQAPRSQWMFRTLMIDGTVQPCLYAELADTWCATVDLPTLTLGIAAAGLSADDYGLEIVELGRYSTYREVMNPG